MGLGDFLNSMASKYTEPITQKKFGKGLAYGVTDSGFYSLRATAHVLSRACRHRNMVEAQQYLGELRQLAASLVAEVRGEDQTRAQLAAILDTANRCVQAAQNMQMIHNPIAAFARQYGQNMPDTIAPGDPYLGYETRLLRQCETLITQGDKYLNPNPNGNNHALFDRWGNRRDDPYDQNDDDNDNGHTYYVDRNGNYQ
jgi:hypothetical protein